MINLYEQSKETNYRQLECDGLLFVEYQCLPGEGLNGVWSHHSHIVYGVRGRKKWISEDEEYLLGTGNAIFCQKGGHYVQQKMDQDTCVLLFFIPDDFIQEILIEYQDSILSLNTKANFSGPHILKIDVDVTLKSFFDSVLGYFFRENSPSPHLLKLKFKELVLQLLTSPGNKHLVNHFISLAHQEKISLKQIMQDNFLYNLSLDDYARLSHRSLSTFKRDFYEVYAMTPGKWLVEQRLMYAKKRLLTTEENINDIAFHSGFESNSHFIRCFKKYFGLPPFQFKQKELEKNMN